MENRHNCNLCKNKIFISKIGYICFGNKYRGKVIEEDDTICDEYEFGGFIELSEMLSKIKEQVNELREYSNYINTCGTTHFKSIRLMNEAADTIESLSIKSESTICNSGWIPCSERLPRDMEDVLISMGKLKAIPAYLRNKKWYLTDCRGSSTELEDQSYVIAWQPLPEPYKPSND